jgi:hypothetical protein
MNEKPVQHKTVIEIETVLRQMLEDYRKIAVHVRTHQAALKVMNLKAMDESARGQELVRSRIIRLDARRRALFQQISTQYRVTGTLKLTTLAEMFPAHRVGLLQLRKELGELAREIETGTRLSARVAGAVLGHLNTAVRILAGAVERSGVYTSAGVPRIASRIGLMDARG